MFNLDQTIIYLIIYLAHNTPHAMASIPPNLESKLGATFPQFWTQAQVPPNFWLKFSPSILGFFPL